MMLPLILALLLGPTPPASCLPPRDFFNSCTLTLRGDQTLVHGDEYIENDLVSYSYIVANKEGYIAAQCQLLVYLPDMPLVERCEVSPGMTMYRAGTLN